MTEITISCIQSKIASNKEQNRAHLTQEIIKAHEQDANLIVLSELHNSPYFCQERKQEYFELAETIPGESTHYFSQIAKDLHVVLVISLFEKTAENQFYNTSLVIDADGHLAGTYRKTHIPNDPGYYEKYYFEPGNQGINPIETSLGKLGILICWDQWYPEPARIMALKGADLLIYPTAIGFDPRDDQARQLREREAWITVQRGHAICNHTPVIACNRVGFETDFSGETQGINFWGSSFITGYQGELLALGSTDQNEIVTATIDQSQRQTVKQVWPYFRDRRIDEYQDLLKQGEI